MALTDEQEKELKAANEKAAKEKDDEIARLKGELEKKGKTKEEDDKDKDKKKEDDKDLDKKAREEREANEKKAGELKQTESALKFNLSVENFAKDNKDYLPNHIGDILKQGEKVNYDSAIEKANALRFHIIKAFFEVQDNMNLLTASQKSQVEDYLKLTVTAQHAKSGSIFDSIFEPTLETLKKVKKAEQVGLSKSGSHTGTKTENDYKQKMIGVARKTHLGEGAKNA